ncbi:MAG: C40 family peptidase [Selenomonadaceae bacterium]|nr:C40 family peptidase [Selenomonadaceae bacterium]
MKLKILSATVAILFLLSASVQASPTLSKNSTGEEVIALQKKLYLIGYAITEIDGIFGNETEKAVSDFQKDQKISVTGIVTNATWRALQKAKPVKGRTLEKTNQQKDAKTKEHKVNTLKEPSSPAKDGTAVSFGKTFMNNQQGIKIIETGKKYIGVPYVFGGTTPKGFDCSGFVQFIFKQHGFILPRLADEQYLLGTSAKVSQLSAGDLVFFSTYTAGVSHCGVYVGDRNFIHASSSKGIRIDSLDSDYWKTKFVGAKKIID